MSSDRQPRLFYPHVVHLPSPEGGWGEQLKEIAGWCSARFAPGSCHFNGAWHFKRAEDAAAFRARWDRRQMATPAADGSPLPKAPS
jgi:hypothetical protein